MDSSAVLTEVLIGILQPVGGPCPQAGEIVNSVRDMVPDPVYNDLGEPQPDADGSFLRAQSLYRWLTNGIRELTRRSNWTVLDWTAMAQQPRQQIYSLDRRFINVEACYCNAYRLLHMDELHTIYPSFASAQPLWFSWHHRSDHLELSLWPAPDRVEPVPFLSADVGPTSDVLELTSTEGFLPFGWLRIDGELLMYYGLGSDLPPLPLSPTAPLELTVVPAVLAGPEELLIAQTLQPAPVTGGQIQVLRRGAGGTQAAAHHAGARVEHLSLWCRGPRVPSAVTQSTDCVELPMAFQAPLETYVLAKVREAEQDRTGAQSLMQEFVALTNEILTDPTWQAPPHPMQARAYGEAPAGAGLWYGRIVVP